MNLKDADIHCPRCGRVVTLGEIDFEGDFINCPDCANEQLVSEQDVREVLSIIENEATNHGGDYSSGMRLARHLAEVELLEEVKSDDPRE